jgi:hypothetical protein
MGPGSSVVTRPEWGGPESFGFSEIWIDVGGADVRDWIDRLRGGGAQCQSQKNHGQKRRRVADQRASGDAEDIRLSLFACVTKISDLCWRSGIQKPPPPEKVEPVATMVSGMRCCLDLRLGFLSPKSPQRSVQAVQCLHSKTAGESALAPTVSIPGQWTRSYLCAVHCPPPLWWAFGFRVSNLLSKRKAMCGPPHVILSPAESFQFPQARPEMHPIYCSRQQAKASRESIASALGKGRRGRESTAASIRKLGFWCFCALVSQLLGALGFDRCGSALRHNRGRKFRFRC